MMWMNLETVTQSEVRKSNKCSILTHLYVESRKMVLMNEPICQARTETQT